MQIVKSKFKQVAVALGLAAVVLLQGCGGSGAGAGGAGTPAASSSSTSSSTSSSSSGTPATTKVQVLSNNATLNSDGKLPIDLIAVVTNANNVAQAGKKVTFAAVDGVAGSGVRLEVIRDTTDQTGTATAKLYLLADATERDVKVTAQSGDATVAEFTVRISGTTLALSGPAQVAFNGSSAAYTVVVKNSSGEPIAGKAVTFKSTANNTLSATSVTTDASGQASFSVRGTVAGADTITATALGSTTIKTINVSSQSLSVTPSATVVPIGATGATFTIAYTTSTGNASGTAIVSNTGGTVSSNSVAVPASGTATFTASSNEARLATIRVSIGDSVATTDVNFVAVTPARIDLQASPTTIGPNLGTATSQRTVLGAVVRDAFGNPVANQTVTFSATRDASGGRIDPPAAITDFAGRATVAYIAGANTTPPNGVQIEATIANNVAIKTTSTLSVSQQQLFVTMGTNNKVEDIAATVYGLRYGVFVTDATGNPVANAIVQAKVKPTEYAEGSWSVVAGRWKQTITRTDISEDLNGDGVCAISEDTNTDGRLTPGNVAAVDTNAPTNASGYAEIVVRYAKSFGNWVEVELETTTTVGGSEGRARERFYLSISATDVSDITVPPPGVVSPFPYNKGRIGTTKCSG